MSRVTSVDVLPMPEITRFVVPRLLSDEPKITHVFTEILRVANEFVPSEAGSIMLDDPYQKAEHGRDLVFIASFGEQSAKIPGTRLTTGKGISWKVYASGEPYMQNDVSSDPRHDRGVDEMTDYSTRSLLCIPIVIQDTVCGVLSLLNCLSPGGFQQQHLDLMTIFSGYITTSMQNVIDSARLEEQARRDHLTGLYNDRYFFERLGQELEDAIANKRELGLLFFDLDHFKGVVDTYGHLVGGQVLQEVGWLFHDLVEEQNAVLARYGGDEYTAILPNVSRERLLELAEIVRAGIASAVFIKGKTIDGRPPLNISRVFTASIGVAYLSEIELPEGDLVSRRNRFIRYADEAMYAAKTRGKNQVAMAPDNRLVDLSSERS